MKKFTKIGLIALAAASVSQFSFAASNTNASSGTGSAKGSTAKIEQQIAVLDSDLSQLNARHTKGHHLFAGLNESGAMPLGKLTGVDFTSDYLQNASHFTHGLTLGGELEFDIQNWAGSYQQSNYGNNGSGSGLYLTAAKLFFLFKQGHWASFLGDIKANTTSGANYSGKFGTALLVIGDLKKSPFFGAIGQTDVPFGSFGGGGPWSSALNYEAFKVGNTPLAELGFQKDGFNVTTSAFNTDKNATSTSSGAARANISDFSIDTQYTHRFNKTMSISAGLGYLNDIQGTASGLGAVLNGKKNAAYDANILFNVKTIGLFAEYDRAQRKATTLSTSNGIPASWVTSISYGHPLYNDIPATFSLSYSGTQNMENIPLGLSGDANGSVTASAGLRSSYIASVSIEPITHVYVSPEFEEAITYNHKKTWATTLDITSYF